MKLEITKEESYLKGTAWYSLKINGMIAMVSSDLAEMEEACKRVIARSATSKETVLFSHQISEEEGE